MGEKLPRILPKVANSTSFWVLLHAVNLRYVTDGFISSRKEGVLSIFWPEKSDGFGGVRTRDLGYQRLVRLSVDHRNRQSKQLFSESLQLRK